MSANENQEPKLKKTLTVFNGITILIGITIGVGIYSTPQIIATYQNSFTSIIVLWIIAGLFVYIGGLIYAELGTRLPNTGGEYVYLNKAFGPYIGFIFGWSQLFIIRTSPAAGLAIIAVNYMGHFGEMTPFTQSALAALLIVLIGALNYIGIRQASIFQNISTIIKAGGLFILVALGLFMVQDQANLISEVRTPQTDLGPMGALGATMMLIVFSYLGWDRVGYSAGEMKNPKKVIPKSMFLGIALVIIIYVAAIFLYHYVLGMDGVRGAKTVALDASAAFLGPIGVGVIAATIIISALGSINGTMMTAPRVYYAMAKDKLFFSWFGFVHPKFRTPSRAIIAHVIWAIIILLVRKNFENIVAGMTFAVLIFYTMTTLALFKLRRDKVGGEDIYKMPGYPILPAIYFLGLVTLIVIRGYFEWEKSLIDIAFIATGIPFAIYFISRKNKK